LDVSLNISKFITFGGFITCGTQLERFKTYPNYSRRVERLRWTNQPFLSQDLKIFGPLARGYPISNPFFRTTIESVEAG
jgi:hypothetical protein